MAFSPQNAFRDLKPVKRKDVGRDYAFATIANGWQKEADKVFEIVQWLLENGKITTNDGPGTNYDIVRDYEETSDSFVAWIYGTGTKGEQHYHYCFGIHIDKDYGTLCLIDCSKAQWRVCCEEYGPNGRGILTGDESLVGLGSIYSTVVGKSKTTTDRAKPKKKWGF